jgi:hypothetical protein
VRAFIVIPGDFLLDRLHAYADFDQVFQASLKIGLGAAQFQDHKTFLPGQNAGLEDIEAQIKFLNQLVDDRLTPVLLGKMENHLLGSHSQPPVIKANLKIG